MAGLIFQVVTLAIFIILFLEYVIRYSHSRGTKPINLRIKVFLTFLFLAGLFIFARCAFRIKELEDGYSGELIHNEKDFMILEAG